MPPRKTPKIYLVSDGRGETARQVVQAAAVQFEGKRYRAVIRSRVRTPEQVDRVVKQAAADKALIFYTLVAKNTRSAMRKASTVGFVPTVDVLGPAFTALHELFKVRRGSTPGLLYQSDRERLDRMDAVDYTLKHDDGQRPSELRAADVVIVGVSRASKSSTCFFLAYQGICAANVPLIPGIDPPRQLLGLAPEKVIGLRVNVDRLRTVRETRARDLGYRHMDHYLDKRALAKEVLEANQTMEERGWASIDVSYMAIEEIAKEVMRLRGLKPETPW